MTICVIFICYDVFRNNLIGLIMTLEQLTNIIKTADKKQITKQLKELGYVDCKKDKELQNLSIETLFKGELKETETFPDGKCNRTYQGGIFRQVKGYERSEFIMVNINDNKNTFPVNILIWAKEI